VKTKEAFIDVPGASLYHKVRGSGPFLLILQGGAGDADASEGLASRLSEHFTVVTYDRRGLSRSRLTNGCTGTASTIETHSDDAFRLLRGLTHDPAFLIGHSIGAMIALDLAGRHPECVRVLLAHEPPVAQLLADGERHEVEHAIEEMEEAYLARGSDAALERLVTMVRLDPKDREPDARRPRPSPYTADNLEFFFTNDAPAYKRYLLDLKALKSANTHIVVGGGAGSRGVWTRNAAERLAEQLGTEMVEFSGDHDGFGMHPKAFAARFLEIVGSEE